MNNTVQMLDVPRLDTTTALRLAAEQAARITAAEGVAIALGSAKAMCCCASAGNAPDVGVMVGPDSGLSGVCMRTSEVVQCDDTATDPRVAPQAGRQLNLRSVLIVPVVVDGHLQAMLQVVSSKPHAFNSRHRDYLSHMARGIATLLSDADTRQRPATGHPASPASTQAAGEPVEAAAPASANSAALGTDETIAPARPTPAIPKVVSLAASALPASVPVGEDGEQRSAAIASEVPRAEGSHHVLPSAVQWRSLPVTRKAGIGVAVVLVLALGWYLIGHSSSPAGMPVTKASASSATGEQRTGAAAAAPEITVEQSSLSVGGLEEAPKVTDSAAQLTPGKLLRKVEPVYPASARAQGIGGTVVLSALVTKDGKVTDVQFVRGPEALVSPTIDAVRQWVYEPYRLGGAPVAARTMISVRFTPHQKP